MPLVMNASCETLTDTDITAKVANRIVATMTKACKEMWYAAATHGGPILCTCREIFKLAIRRTHCQAASGCAAGRRRRHEKLAPMLKKRFDTARAASGSCVPKARFMQETMRNARIQNAAKASPNTTMCFSRSQGPFRSGSSFIPVYIKRHRLPNARTTDHAKESMWPHVRSSPQHAWRAVAVTWVDKWHSSAACSWYNSSLVSSCLASNSLLERTWMQTAHKNIIARSTLQHLGFWHETVDPEYEVGSQAMNKWTLKNEGF